MKSKTIIRIISVIILGVLLGVWFHHGTVKWGQKGRKAYLAAQAEHFDKEFAHPIPVAEEIVQDVIMLGVVVGIYELLACGLSRIVKIKNDEMA